MPIIGNFPGGKDPSKGLTATSSDILEGKTAAVNGAVVTGALAPKTTKYGNAPGQISTIELFIFKFNPNYKGRGNL
jgi:hypothetical protein